MSHQVSLKHSQWKKIPDVLILSYCLLLIFFSVFYVKERIICTDTAGYLYTIVRDKWFYVPTNRYVAIFSQLLPLAGVVAGLSLKSVMYLYSLNCMLIPVGCSLFCNYVLRDKGSAISILLFYTLMGRELFYYPVSEFQMGLCLLLLYHSCYLYHLKQNKPGKILFVLLSLILVTTITFSHPLSIIVLFAWILCMFISRATRSRALIIPPAIAIVAHFTKEHFFKAMVGSFDYEHSKKEGLHNFGAGIASYFESTLSRSSLKAFTDHYFMAFLLVILLLGIFIAKKRWIELLVFPALLFAFWIIVTVAFKDYHYDYYTEHLYQPLPFFIALFAGTRLFQTESSNWARYFLLTTTGLISFGKINSGHTINLIKINWYERYLSFMRTKDIKAGALPKKYVPGNFDAYWASKSESILLSSMQGPDSARYLLIHWTPDQVKDIDTAAIYIDNTYFHIPRNTIPVTLDSVATEHQLDSLNYR